LKSDADVLRDVNDELTWDPSISNADIQATVTDGMVALRGTVGSYYEKEQAERASRRVFGVTSVDNELAVEPTAVSKRNDVDLVVAVQNALDWAASVPADRTTFEVIDGWVTLHGNVDWNYQRQAAEDAVSSLVGVKGVTNLITLDPQPQSDDVHQRIQQALTRNATTDANNIKVERHNGTITLRGTVRSWAERDEAESAAWAAPGVTDVIDDIVIAY
jgi:osmotically-inducible protein OsmY